MKTEAAEPALKKAKAEPDATVPKSKIMASMPRLPADGSNPSLVLYKGGVIHTSRKKRRFRALTTRCNEYTEKSKAWGGDAPTKESWKAVVNAIDAKHK